MSFWQLEHLRRTVGGTWAARRAGSPEATGLSIDTRSLIAGQVYLAVRGERHDGHDYLAQAAAAGASVAIVEREAPLPEGLPAIRVAETRRALLRLAGAYRRTLERTKVIGVTGSNGKTTTTRLIHAVLSRSLRGSASLKSFNNHIGVPLTILGAKPADQYLVCEIGTSAPGEVSQLAEAVRPDVAVITSVGREHLEGLGSLERVAGEEAAQLEHLEPGGLAVVNAEAPHLSSHVAMHRAGRRFNVVAFGFGAGADLRVGDVRQDNLGISFTINGRAAFRLPLLGRHNASNAAAAVAVGKRLGLDDAAIAAGLAAVTGAEMRLERAVVGGVHIVNDAYNANPDSMLAALGTLAEMEVPGGRKVAVLGDMLELGPASGALHREVIERALGAPDLARLVLVGPLMAEAAQGFTDGRIALETALEPDAAERVAAALTPGDLVLIKGSRRMGLERLLPVLGRRVPAPA